MSGSLEQCQQFGYDGSIGFSLDALIGAEIDTCNLQVGSPGPGCLHECPSCRCSAPDGVVLTGLFMSLWVEVCLSKDVDLALPCRVPVDDLPAKGGDIGIVQLVVCLFKSWSFLWTWMERRIKIWFLRWW